MMSEERDKTSVGETEGEDVEAHKYTVGKTSVGKTSVGENEDDDFEAHKLQIGKTQIGATSDDEKTQIG